jgi:hypothetical protein
MEDQFEHTQPGGTTRRAVLIAGGGLGLVALLGGVAYVASRFVTPPSGTNDGGVMQSFGSGGVAGVPLGQPIARAVKGPNIKNAAEIPSAPPDVQGIFRKREDNSLFIGTGNVTLAIPASNTSGGQMNAQTDGPDVEVVVTRKTHIFKDTTPITMDAIESGRELQQKVEQIESLDALVDALGKADGLSVWGARNGDRYVAETILYRPPVMLSRSS